MTDLSMTAVDRLLHLHWPTAPEVATQLGMPDGTWLTRMRQQGQVLGCWDRHLGQFRYPSFQFDERGQVRPAAVALLAAMLAHPDWSAEADADGWRKALWLHQPQADLDGTSLTEAVTPAARFIEDPVAVLACVQERWTELETV